MSMWDPFGIDRYFRSRLGELFGPFGDELDLSVTPRQSLESGSGGSQQVTRTGGSMPSLASSGLFSNFGRVRLDVTERPAEFAVTAEIPGIPKENLKIYTEGNMLIIEGERKQESRQEDERAHVSERSYGRFQRSLRMPDNCNLEDCKSSYENGILNLSFGKKEPTNRKSISL